MNTLQPFFSLNTSLACTTGQGMTLRPCLVHLHINFLDTCRSAKITNKFESKNIKFHKSICRNWEIVGFKYEGVQDRTLMHGNFSQTLEHAPLCRSAFLPADTTITRRVAATIEVASSVVHRKCELCLCMLTMLGVF